MRKHIKQAVDDLEDWQAKFDPSWYLITRIASSSVDERLQDVPQNDASRRLAQMREASGSLSVPNNQGRQSIFRDATIIQEHAEQVSYSNSFVSYYTDQPDHAVLLDRTNYPVDTPRERVKPYVRNLARKLHNVDPMTFGLLKCDGVMEVSEVQDGTATTQFQFIFDIPASLSLPPASLRHLLRARPQYPLGQRIQLAQQLARSVMFVHTADFVHKNIRPETIIIFHEESRLGPSFLTGFERIRPADAPTDNYGDSKWEKNIYRHPSRQGLLPDDYYKMQHDVYSLGVCLLEIGLWCSFVCEDDNGGSVPWEQLDISEALADEDTRGRASAIKRALVALAKERLPCIVGERYTQLTTACLTCLDKGDENVFGNQAGLEDEDGIIVGVRYIERENTPAD
ncbi:hypothetical protein BDV38DRAFT_280775 [Aspergillus pseudotamarii]|uniref:Protein kinase domain-containing protein n=1 Tax=Aspergillus pseudotamarii TaxID=132259 RepID=A0A5N6SZ01_ASPPS|nr:uncharacterized protein BDV38DRAFT_280775 [Aspergillus pseudotamarii]KAE8139862.1 hypothetical protein BDV38DRAFT_280775 [Aspergillus pseudotamarii]